MRRVTRNVASLALSSYAAGGLCSDLTGSIMRGINAIFDAIHVQYVNLPKTGISFLDGLLQGMANLVVDGVNIVIEQARKIVVNSVEFLISEVLSIVAKVAALAAMVGGFLSWSVPWTSWWPSTPRRRRRARRRSRSASRRPRRPPPTWVGARSKLRLAA